MIELDAFPAPDGPVDLRVARGEVVLLRGPNGSGKTSILRALAGLDAPLRPRAARVLGAPARETPAAELARLVTFSPQEATDILVGLTVEGEFRQRGLAMHDEARPLARRETAKLSSGEARRVWLALARARAAPLLLLDEPAERLDAEGRERLRALVREAQARGAVVAADHGDVLSDLATRIVHLGPRASAAWSPLPAPEGPIVLRHPAATRDGISFPELALPPGLHALVGPNGSGKTTLLRRLAAEAERPGVDLRAAPADARLALTRGRVREEVAGLDADVVDALVAPALLDRHPLTLSAGEAQRVALAKALGAPARVYLLDEPDAHLDALGREALQRILVRRIEEGACVLAATHDPALVAVARSVVRMGDAP